MNSEIKKTEDIASIIEKQPSVEPTQIASLLAAGKFKGEFLYVLFWADWCRFCTPAKEGFVDFLRNKDSYNLPQLDICQYKMATIEEVRKHPVIQHPQSPWPEEKVVITSIPTAVLIRVNYRFPSIFAKDKAMASGAYVAAWIEHCMTDLSK